VRGARWCQPPPFLLSPPPIFFFFFFLSMKIIGRGEFFFDVGIFLIFFSFYFQTMLPVKMNDEEEEVKVTPSALKKVSSSQSCVPSSQSCVPSSQSCVPSSKSCVKQITITQIESADPKRDQCFLIQHTNSEILNVIRREFDFVPALMFEHRLNQIKENTTMMKDDDLCQRIDLLPIDCDERLFDQQLLIRHEDCSCDNGGCWRCQFVFELCVSTANQSADLWTDQFKLKLKPEHQKIFEENPTWRKPSIPNTLLCLMGEKTSIKMQIIARVHHGGEYAAAKIVLRSIYKPLIKFDVNPEFGTLATANELKMIHQTCSYGVFDDYDWKQPLPRANQDRCVQCRACVLALQSVCNAIQKRQTTTKISKPTTKIEIETEEKEKQGIKKESSNQWITQHPPSTNTFHFRLRTTGMIYSSPASVCVRSCLSLWNRLHALQNEIRSMKVLV
jgi:hypothetical protein